MLPFHSPKLYVSPANFLLHFLQCHIPFESLFTPALPQKGHFCFNLCFSSTLINFCLTFFPYLALNLPADFVFFNLLGILNIKWGCPDLNRGRQVPNLKGYQATPQKAVAGVPAARETVC